MINTTITLTGLTASPVCTPASTPTDSEGEQGKRKVTALDSVTSSPVQSESDGDDKSEGSMVSCTTVLILAAIKQWYFEYPSGVQPLTPFPFLHPPPQGLPAQPSIRMEHQNGAVVGSHCSTPPPPSTNLSFRTPSSYTSKSQWPPSGAVARGPYSIPCTPYSRVMLVV